MENMLTHTKSLRKLFREELFIPKHSKYALICTNNYPKCRTVKVYTGMLKNPVKAGNAVRSLLDSEGLVEGVDYSLKTTSDYTWNGRIMMSGGFIVRLQK